MAQSPHATDSEGLTVEELAVIVQEWPREVDGRPCRVWLGVSASQMRTCEVVASPGDGSSDLIFDAAWSEPAMELVRGNPDVQPLRLALAALSYGQHTCPDAWDDDYFHELATRATAALEGLLRADASLAAFDALPSGGQPWLVRVLLLPWHAAGLLFRRDSRLSLQTRLLLTWWLFVESLRP